MERGGGVLLLLVALVFLAATLKNCDEDDPGPVPVETR